MSTSYEPQSGRPRKRKTRCGGMPQASINSSIDIKNAYIGIAIMSKSKL